jgi:MFS family permease
MFAGIMAGFQIPSGLLSERLGTPLVLAAGTALAGAGYCLAPFVESYAALVAILLIAGLGASTQHPLASSLVARAFSGSRSLSALGTYNFAGDLGKMALPAAAALLVVMLPWRTSLALLGLIGFIAAIAILFLTPRFAAEAKPSADGKADGAPARGAGGFPVLLSIGVIDSASKSMVTWPSLAWCAAESRIDSTTAPRVASSAARASSHASMRDGMAFAPFGLTLTFPNVATAPCLPASIRAACTVDAKGSIGSRRSTSRVVPAWLASPPKVRCHLPCGQIDEATATGRPRSCNARPCST